MPQFFRSCLCEVNVLKVKPRCFVILDRFECAESFDIMLLCAFLFIKLYIKVPLGVSMFSTN